MHRACLVLVLVGSVVNTQHISAQVSDEYATDAAQSIGELHILATDAILDAQQRLDDAIDLLELSADRLSTLEQYVAEQSGYEPPPPPPVSGLPLHKLSCPPEPTSQNNHYQSWACTMAADPAWDGVGAHDWKFGVGMHPTTDEGNPATLVFERHPSGGGNSWVAQTVAAIGTVEVRTQDGEIYGCTEFWIPSTCHGGTDAVNWSGIRAQAALAYVVDRWGDVIDLERGLRLKGKSLGGSWHANMIPGWEHLIAAVVTKIGSMNMDYQLELAPKSGPDGPYWRQYDLRDQLPIDPQLRSQYRYAYWAGNDGIVDFDPGIQALANQHKVPHCFIVHGGPHGAPAADDIKPCEEQEVTLDRPVVAFSNSSANVDCTASLRCHSNLGLGWDYHDILDSEVETRIPVRYLVANVGAYLDPMPAQINVDATVYRAGLTPGATVGWSYAGQSGQAIVDDDATVTFGLMMDSSPAYQDIVVTK